MKNYRRVFLEFSAKIRWILNFKNSLGLCLSLVSNVSIFPHQRDHQGLRDRDFPLQIFLTNLKYKIPTFCQAFFGFIIFLIKFEITFRSDTPATRNSAAVFFSTCSIVMKFHLKFLWNFVYNRKFRRLTSEGLRGCGNKSRNFFHIDFAAFACSCWKMIVLRWRYQNT